MLSTDLRLVFEKLLCTELGPINAKSGFCFAATKKFSIVLSDNLESGLRINAYFVSVFFNPILLAFA